MSGHAAEVACLPQAEQEPCREFHLGCRRKSRKQTQPTRQWKFTESLWARAWTSASQAVHLPSKHLHSRGEKE